MKRFLANSPATRANHRQMLLKRYFGRENDCQTRIQYLRVGGR